MFLRVHGVLQHVARVATWVGGGALTCTAIIVTVDVIFRKLAGVTISGADEIAGYVFAAATAWAYAYCLLYRANVRIDAIYNLLPSWPRAVFDVLGVFLLLGFVAVLTERALYTLQLSIEYGSVSITTLTTPLWIPQLFWVGGLVLFVVTLLFVGVYSLTALLRRDLSTVHRVAGVLSVEEEIRDETRGMDGREGARTSEPRQP